jgi:hypothetical protein
VVEKAALGLSSLLIYLDLASVPPSIFSMCLRCALLANIIPKANPIIAPREAPVIKILSEDALLVPASKNPTYAMDSIQKIRRNFIAVYLLRFK